MDGLIYDRGGRREEGKKEQEEQEGGLGKARAYKEGRKEALYDTTVKVVRRTA